MSGGPTPYLVRVDAGPDRLVIVSTFRGEEIVDISGPSAKLIQDTALALPEDASRMFLHGVVLMHKATQESLASDTGHSDN